MPDRWDAPPPTTGPLAPPGRDERPPGDEAPDAGSPFGEYPPFAAGEHGPVGGPMGQGSDPGSPRKQPGWFRRVSFRSRLSLIAAAAVGIALLLAALTSYFAVRHQLYNQVDTTLTNESSAVVDAAGNGLPSVPFRQAIFHLESANDACAQLVTDTGLTLTYSSANAPGGAPSRSTAPGACGLTLPPSRAIKALTAPSANGDSTIITQTVAGQRYRIYATGLGTQLLPVQQGGVYPQANVALVVYTPLSFLDHTLSVLRLILILVSLGGVALAIALGYLAARAMIRPVERLTAAAEHVAVTQDLNATIEEDGQDELGRLAHSFNAMLGALGGSRRQQAQLVADAGHELRTPLTSLRTNVEVLMRIQDLPPADRAALLADVEGQLSELTTLVGDLVELAREDEQTPEPVEIGLDGVVQRAVERAKRRAGSVHFAVETEPGLVRAQPALLERAVLNVLDNAVKWSPPDGLIEVRLRRVPVDHATGKDGGWHLDVRDHGPGIPPEDLPKVFDRFYRAPTARAMSGSGLGLAIVRQVFWAHGGDASITCPPDGGTLVHLELPAATDAPGTDWPPPPPDGSDHNGSFSPAGTWPAPPEYPNRGEATGRPAR